MYHLSVEDWNEKKVNDLFVKKWNVALSFSIHFNIEIHMKGNEIIIN